MNSSVSFRWGRSIFFLFAILNILSSAFAIPDFLIDTGTEIVLDIDRSKSGLLTINAGENADVLKQKSKIVVSFALDEEQASKSYAFRLDASSPAELQVNGRELVTMPVTGEDGWYYRIGAFFLQQGHNEIHILAQEGDLVDPEALQLASLEHTAEDAHFSKFFSIERNLAVQPDEDPGQLKYDADHYDLEITLNMSNTYISGALTMTASSTDSSLSTCVLDFNDNGGNMNVLSVDQGPSTSALPYTHNGSQNRIFITLPAAVPEGNTFTVRVNYQGTPPPTGIFAPAVNRTTHTGTPIIFTFSEPYKARDWWPCKDVPGDKATIDLHITCPTGYTPVSNGSLEGIVDNGDSTHTYNWSESFPVATYLISICCTNYQKATGTYVSQDGLSTMEVSHYVYPESYTFDSQGLAGTLEAMDFFASTFGEYPFLTEKYVTATHADGAGMEHQTCTSMPDNDVGLSGGLGRRNIHELAHQWFGDQITMGHFDHLWLNEGFGTYCEALFYEWKNGEAAYHSYVAGWSTSDAYPIVSSSADSFSGYIVYRKGAWVLHMLRHIVGDVNFFQACRNYLADPDLSYGNAMSSDLQAHFETVYGEPLGWFFNQWLYQANRPDYTWSWTTHTDGIDTIVDIYIEQNQSGDTYTMPIDFRAEDIGGATYDFTVLNDQASQSFHVNIGTFTPTNLIFDPDNYILAYKSESSSLITPDVPNLKSIKCVFGQADRLLVSWEDCSSDPNCDGYELYMSQSLTGWTLVEDSDVLTSGVTSHTVQGLTAGQDYYFKLRCVGPLGTPSDFSDVYGGVPISDTPTALIVEGYDRWTTQSRGSSYTGAYYHGAALSAYGVSFDTCDNSEVGVNFTLADYDLVLWVLGEESTVEETFTNSEQGLVETYLDGGGNLFVSGAEIGWDLDYRGTVSDKSFYNNYLKADYAADDSETITAQGVSSSCFDSIGSFDFDFYYYADYPDVLTPANGSTACIEYFGGIGGTAALSYDGTYKLVYLGFGFETINGESNRNLIMAAALDFLLADLTATATPTETPTGLPTVTPTYTPTSTPTETPTDDTPPGDLIVDNVDPGYSDVYSDTEWLAGTSAVGRYGTSYRFNDSGTGNDVATWQVTIPYAGFYTVSVWYPQGTNRADNSPFTVNYSGGSELFLVNQQSGGDQWNPLGTHYYDIGDYTVTLSDDAHLSVVLADAVKWSFYEGTPTYTPTSTPTQTPAPEYRSIWADSWNSSFLTSSEADELIQTCRDNNINTIMAEIRKIGDAYYDSAHEPRATNISGGSTFDPLGYLIQKAHDTSGGKNYIQVHGWFVMHRISKGETLDPTHVLSQHPEYIMLDSIGNDNSSGTKYLDPGHPGAVDHNIAVILDCMSKYDLDGVNLDYIRYPEASGEWGYNLTSVQRFNDFYGKSGSPAGSDSDWDHWRRECVTNEVKKLYVKMWQADPTVVLTADTINWGYSWDNFESSSAYAGVFQDWVGWLQEGIFDYNALMNYSTSYSRFCGWTDLSLNNDGKRGSIIGCGNYLQSSTQDGLNQMLYARGQGSSGLNIYDWGSECNASGDTRETFYSELNSQVYPSWVDVPTPGWKLAPVTGIFEGTLTNSASAVDHGSVSIDEIPGSEVFTDGTGWFGIMDVAPGTYHLRFSKPGIGERVVEATINSGGDIITVDVDFATSINIWSTY